jgi:hypothetical protein
LREPEEDLKEVIAQTPLDVDVDDAHRFSQRGLRESLHAALRSAAPIFPGDQQNRMDDALRHSTAILAIRIDSEDRLRNTRRCLVYLLSRFAGLRIIVREDGVAARVRELLRSPEVAAYGDRVRYFFVEEHSKIFHRTKRLNECLKQVETPVMIIHDVDVILPVASMLEAQRIIMEEGYGAVTPFTNPPGCTDVAQKDADLLVSDVSTHEKLAVIYRTHFAGNGFSLFVATKRYADGGGENEDFVSYGPKDDARLYSHTRLGLRYGRVRGRVFHMEHQRGVNSSPSNPLFASNVRAFQRIKAMDRTQLSEHFMRRRIPLDHAVPDVAPAP